MPHICLTKHEIDWCFSIDHRVHSEMMLTASSFPLLTEHIAMNVYFGHFDCLSTQVANFVHLKMKVDGASSIQANFLIAGLCTNVLDEHL